MQLTCQSDCSDVLVERFSGDVPHHLENIRYSSRSLRSAIDSQIQPQIIIELEFPWDKMIPQSPSINRATRFQSP